MNEPRAPAERSDPALQATMDAADPVPPALQETIAPSQWESANKDGAARGQDRGRATPTGAARDRSWDKTERPDTGPALRTTDSTALPGGSRGSLASPDDDAHLPGPGARIAHYELIRELGRGGMGVVFLARDTRLARRVAIKFLRTDSPDMTQRFLVEARATARCHHENIVVIHDIADHDGMPFMVLEYLHGQNLDKLMREEPLAPLRAIEIMIPVARALSRAHEHGIVHRDLKPANIFVGESGTIKVLDFGIAKLLAEQGESALPARFEPLDGHGPPPTAGFAGTLPYMAPEQLNNEDIDHRADIWAAGIILYELMHGHHPMAPISYTVLLSIGIADEPMPSAHRDGQGEHPLHRSLAELIDHCLIKDRSRRLASASELAERLEELLPRNQRQRLNEDECPYPGLLSFSESDADRFFGRSDDVTQVVARLRKQPLLGVTGPTGSGKSSFVNAGVIPALRGSGDSWHILKVRPGRAPLAALASAMAPLTTLGDQPSDDPLREQRELSQRLRREPGYLGAALRRRADRTGGRILLVVDPLEELYTLTGDPDHRLAFTTALAGAADDVSSPVRVILATRSDFLDRVAEDRYLMHELAGNLIFLGPPERDALEEALIGPADLAGYRFESNDLVATIIAEVEATPSSLPLLQFAASKLWETRDRRSKQLTAASYHHIGGLIGALTSHANQVVAEIFQLSAGAPRVTRALFQRLVTPERTRAITPIAELSAELEPLCSDPDEVAQIIDRLVSARLLVAHGGGEHSGEDGSAGSGPTVELIHDSLIHSWPRLRRWLDDNADDAAMRTELTAAARQWHNKGRPSELLWRGRVLDDAQRWREHLDRPLAPHSRAFLDAAVALASRAQRIRRLAIAAAMLVLAVIAVGSTAALWRIDSAEQRAASQAAAASQAEQREQQTSARLGQAERTVADREQDLAAANRELRATLAQVEQAAERERRAAEEARRATAEARRLAAAQTQARDEAERSRQQAVTAQQRAERALIEAEQARAEAIAAQRAAESARRAAETLAQRERTRADRAESKMGGDLLDRLPGAPPAAETTPSAPPR